MAAGTGSSLARARRAVLGACVVAAACFAGASPASAATLTLKPTADAHTDASAPATNYGANSSMKVDAQALKISYLRFQPNVSGTITKATLRVYANKASTTGTGVRSLGTVAWNETTITHENRPSALTSTLAQSGPFGAGQWISLNVTPAVTANVGLTLELTTPSTAEALLASREAGTLRAPQLVLEYSTATSPP
ncbi:MAG: DNRLRE domain-containing protein, partial [Solirubrobacteraceae bacterium]